MTPMIDVTVEILAILFTGLDGRIKSCVFPARQREILIIIGDIFN